MTEEEQAHLSATRYGREGRTPAHSRAAASHINSRVEPGAGFVAGGTPTHAASRAEGVSAYTERRKKKGKHRVLKGVLATLTVLIVGAGVAVGLFLSNIDSRLGNKVTDDLRQVLEPVKMDEPFYMLLLGVDKSEGRSEEWGASGANFRADTIILARVDPPAQKVTLVSIPRDTQVNIAGYGDQKINAAYSLGEQEQAGNGPTKMVEVVEDFANVNISHYAEIDFEQLISIVDTIGGVEVTLPVPVKDLTYANIDLPAGTQTLDGTQALALCRSRHAYDEYGGGDFYRAANQRMVIGAIAKKVLKLDPLSIPGVVSELANSVTTDFKATDIVNLALQFKDFDVDNSMYSGQVPTESKYIDSLWYELPIESQWKEMMARVEAGESPYSSEDQDFTSGIAGSVGSGSNISDGDASGEKDSGSVTPSYKGSVLVLNGAGIQGLAAKNSEILEGKGFTPTAENSDTTSNTTTVIYYNDTDGAQASALGVAETLGVSSSNVKPNDGSYSKQYNVVVLLGSDLNK